MSGSNTNSIDPQLSMAEAKGLTSFPIAAKTEFFMENGSAIPDSRNKEQFSIAPPFPLSESNFVIFEKDITRYLSFTSGNQLDKYTQILIWCLTSQISRIERNYRNNLIRYDDLVVANALRVLRFKLTDDLKVSPYKNLGIPLNPLDELPNLKMCLEVQQDFFFSHLKRAYEHTKGLKEQISQSRLSGPISTGPKYDPIKQLKSDMRGLIANTTSQIDANLSLSSQTISGFF